MTQEDKNLLLKDLCARLPYGVMLHYEGWNPVKLTDIDLHTMAVCGMGGLPKPYLRPMSSMTKEEIGEYKSMNDALDENYEVHIDKAFPAFDYLHAHHFDYRGLIEKGLALEAPENMYKTK